MHPRILIRNLFVQMLMGQTDCQERVFKNRARPLIKVEGWAEQLPAIIVYSRGDKGEMFNAAPAEWERMSEFVVEIHAAAGEDTDDLLDHIADQVETIIPRFNWESMGVKFFYLGTQIAFVDNQSDDIIGGCAISFQMTYTSAFPDEGKAALLDDFKTAAQTYQVETAQSLQTVKIYD